MKMLRDNYEKNFQEKIKSIENQQVKNSKAIEDIIKYLNSVPRNDYPSTSHDDSLLQLLDDTAIDIPSSATTTIPTPPPPIPSVSTASQPLLQSPGAVTLKYAKFKARNKISTLAVKLAKESYFGIEVLKASTVRGCRDLPILNQNTLMQMKQFLFQQFPQFWHCPAEFEPSGVLALKVSTSAARE